MNIRFQSSLLALAVFAMSATAIAQDQQRLNEAGIATTNQLREVDRAQARQLEELQRYLDQKFNELSYELEQMHERIRDLERERDLDERREARESLNKRRSLNWPKANSGMTRRQIYRLVGTGVRDKTETDRDCRCYSQGRICFDDRDVGTKSNIRCQI